jgi:hypothetical protein
MPGAARAPGARAISPASSDPIVPAAGKRPAFDVSCIKFLTSLHQITSINDMRTTMTLEKDVAARLEQLARRRRQPLKVIVNEALRAGLSALERPRRQARAFRTTGFDLGPSLVGSLDNVEEVLSRVEGETHR